jgi:hypothetical protein
VAFSTELSSDRDKLLRTCVKWTFLEPRESHRVSIVFILRLLTDFNATILVSGIYTTSIASQNGITDATRDCCSPPQVFTIRMMQLAILQDRKKIGSHVNRINSTAFLKLLTLSRAAMAGTDHQHDESDSNDHLIRSTDSQHPANLIPELCRKFWTLGWVTGTGGGTSIREE